MKKIQFITQLAKDLTKQVKHKTRLNRFRVRKVFINGEQIKNCHALFYSKPRFLYKELRKLSHSTQDIFATRNRKG